MILTLVWFMQIGVLLRAGKIYHSLHEPHQNKNHSLIVLAMFTFSLALVMFLNVTRVIESYQ